MLGVLPGAASACRGGSTLPPQRSSAHYAAVVDGLPSMAGRTFAVTGASRGLGFVTARALASKGAAVLMLNRNSKRAEAARAEVEAAGSSCELIECDLLDFGSVRAAAAAVRAHVADGGLDGLACNAGIMIAPDEASHDGYDITASTNVLSHFLLAKELIVSLERAAAVRGDARVVSMSSGSGFGGPAFDARYLSRSGGRLGGRRASYERYHQSKLSNLLFAASLAERLAARRSAVKSLACTPGVCATDMFVQVASRPGRPADTLSVPSVEDGACAQLKCLCDPTVRSGELWGPPGMGGPPARVALAPPTVLVDDAAKRALWEACEAAVGAIEP